MAQYWYNTRTHEVEEGRQSIAIERLGPFKTRAEAEHAPERVQQRAREWAAEDEKDND